MKLFSCFFRQHFITSIIILELALSIKNSLYGINNTAKMIFVLFYFPRALKRKPVICKSDGEFRFSRILVPFRQRNQRKSFYCHGKYFAKENCRAPAWTSVKFYCRNKKRAIPSGKYHPILPAGDLVYLACLRSLPYNK